MSTRRRRARLIWLMLFGLLFQQFATAAHACEVPFAAFAEASALAVDGNHCERQPGETHPVDALCAKHCTPDQATAHEPVAARLPALPASIAGLQRVTAAVARMDSGIPPTLANPPPLLRFCSLLI